MLESGKVRRTSIEPDIAPNFNGSWQGSWESGIIAGMTMADRIARIRIELNGIDPTIWRRVEVPLTTSLKGLHDAIQAVMPFENYHLFRFDVGDKRYGIPDREWDHVRETLDAKNIRVGALVECGVSAFSYTYDFGDDWRHSVIIENVTAAARLTARQRKLPSRGGWFRPFL
jgi:hypothetical protein